MRRELLEGLVMRDVREGWGVLVRMGLDFRGVDVWTFLRDGQAVSVSDTREEARYWAREHRRIAAACGAPLGLREVRVVRVMQATQAEPRRRRMR
jgi:hypothetical protein